MKSTRYDTIYVPGFKKEKVNAWPKEVWFEDNEVEANRVGIYQRLSTPEGNQQSLSGNAMARCLEGPGHSSLNNW